MSGRQVFKADGRQHWDVLDPDGAAIGFIAKRGNGRSAIRFIARIEGRPVEARPPHPHGGFGSLDRARRAVLLERAPRAGLQARP